MLELVNRAVVPDLSLRRAVHDWDRIARKLADPPRRRTRQTTVLSDILS